jgi:ubiquinol-cytochrome c reductase iron-sulfur subunit
MDRREGGEGQMSTPTDSGGQLEPTGSHSPVGDPIPDPGLPAHRPRLTDVEPAAERRTERQVAGMFALAAVLSVLFCILYLFVDIDATFLGFNASNFALGTTLGLAMLLIGVGAIQWAKQLMSDRELIEERHGATSTPEDRAAALAAFRAGSEESGFGRRTLVRNSLLGGLAMLGLPAVILLGDLGPLPQNLAAQTVWRKGMRIVNDVSGEPLRPEDIEIGQLVNAQPAIFFATEEHDGELEPVVEGVELQNAKSKASVILVRMDPEVLRPYPARRNWDVGGIVCYSKICTHVGCPISLYEQQTHNLLCPCHQSTFDLEDNGNVIFGPAARSLPQLPMSVDDEGYLIATSDFLESVGPSFWERGSA